MIKTMFDIEKISENKIIIFLILASFLITLYCQYPLLINKYALNDDVRQNIYIFLKNQDKSLFNNDFITDFYSKWSPWGVNIFYSIISLFYDPIQFTKILPFFLCFISSLYMFKIGKLLKGNIAGILSGVLYIFIIWSDNKYEFMGAGGVMNFAMIFFIIFLYYFLKKNILRMGLSLIFQLIFFYPPTFLICLLAYIWDIFYKYKKIKKAEIYYLLFLVLIISFLVILKASNSQLQLFGFNNISGMPEFYPGGRKVLFYPSLLEQLVNAETGFAITFPVKFLILALLFLLLFLKRHSFEAPKKLCYFIIASFILYIFATIMLYKLYGPARYIRYSLPTILTILVSINIANVLGKIKNINVRFFILISFLFFSAVLFIPTLYSDYSIAPKPKLYNFLQTLPKDILIAGHPTSMDYIPVYSKRKVLINEETSQPMYANFYPVIKERTYNFFKAYYSNSAAEVYNFCKKYHITHLIVERRHFSKDYLANAEFYLNPFNTYIKSLIAGRKKFILMDTPKNEILFDDGDIFVIKIKDSSFQHTNI
ncbi:MAG: hypothetical protein ABIH18_06955 [Candidatus Omnitrophota bacterium]